MIWLGWSRLGQSLTLFLAIPLFLVRPVVFAEGVDDVGLGVAALVSIKYTRKYDYRRAKYEDSELIKFSFTHAK